MSEWRFYLPCSGLPSAFALSKSEKILVGLYMLTTTIISTDATMSLQFCFALENIQKNHIQSGCTYRGRGGFPSSRRRLSISGAAIDVIENVSVYFASLSSLLEALAWVLPIISPDRLSEEPRSSLRRGRDVIGAHSTATGNNRPESQVHKRWVQPRALGCGSGFFCCPCGAM